MNKAGSCIYHSCQTDKKQSYLSYSHHICFFVMVIVRVVAIFVMSCHSQPFPATLAIYSYIQPFPAILSYYLSFPVLTTHVRPFTALFIKCRQHVLTNFSKSNTCKPLHPFIAYSSLIQPIPAYSSLSKSIPTYSSLF